MDASQQPGILIAQVFLERAEFSHRKDALGLPPTTAFQPNFGVGFRGGVAPDEKTGFVRITVQTKPAERPLYNIDVTMMAIFRVDEKRENLSLKDYVRTTAPAMLYPFVREAVASLTWRGRFGPVWLAPFNVAAVMAHATEETAIPEPMPKIERPSRAGKKRPKARSAVR